jgi:hypothetical protein
VTAVIASDEATQGPRDVSPQLASLAGKKQLSMTCGSREMAAGAS